MNKTNEEHNILIEKAKIIMNNMELLLRMK